MQARASIRATALLVVLCVLSICGGAFAQTGDLPPGEIGALLKWLAARDAAKCTERCFTLERLKLKGSASGAITFELEGGVLAGHTMAIPLFGPPDKIRVENVTDDGKPAAVGFEGDHYFVSTAAKRFVIKGTLTLQKDLALSIPGPLNTLEADLTSGRVIEGARLSGVVGTTVHFATEAVEGVTKVVEEPAVFQLSRAIRVQRESTFEYRLVLRSGNDLGVVRLPLLYGEKVLDVTGISGWKVEGTELILPTAGKTANATITGTLADAAHDYVPDPRSAYEWWLLESDVEHTLAPSGEAKQLDAVESPIAKTQPTSRLFLLERGKKLHLEVQTLASVEALAAVIREHSRMLVWTQKGDMVADDTLFYENNGVDYLAFTATGRPIFQASDGIAQRILRKANGDEATMMIPLMKGAHTARVQSLSQTSLPRFFGSLALPVPEHALHESRATVTIGLPASVIPLAAFGGDKTLWLIDPMMGIAAIVALVASWLMFATRRERVASTLVLFGVWCVAPVAFSVVVAAVVTIVAFRIVSPRLRGKKVRPWMLATAAIVALTAVVMVLGAGASRKERSLSHDDAAVDARHANLAYRSDLPAAAASTAATASNLAAGDTKKSGEALDQTESDKSGVKHDELKKLEWKNELFSRKGEGTLQGVTPVALPLPGYERSLTISRELVTRDRPFRPVLLFVTETTLLVLGAAWLLVSAWFAWSQRAKIAAAGAWLRAWSTLPPNVGIPEGAAVPPAK